MNIFYEVCARNTGEWVRHEGTAEMVICSITCGAVRVVSGGRLGGAHVAVPGRMHGTRRAAQDMPLCMSFPHARFTSEGYVLEPGGPSSDSLLGG